MNGLRIIINNMRDFSSNSFSRNYEIDLLRGLAIVLMVIFHFSYDLTVFGWADFSTSKDIEWRIFRTIIVSSFLLAVGMSSYLAYRKSINKKNWLRRWLNFLLFHCLSPLVVFLCIRVHGCTLA
nr:heparan-alpha-glucosaminide N-acetyltransferase domain-containing protein [Paraglaciecola psychrophila]